MRVDLHNHTPLCNHATGSMREFVLKAIEEKIDIFGFSDHAPIKNDFDKKYRMSIKQTKEYEQNVLALKDEFKDKIEILLGYEVDYIDGLILDEIVNANVDYLIGSVHFLNNWGFDNPEFISEYEKKDIDKIWQEYFLNIKKMAKTKYFNIVGHLDLIKVFKFYPKNNFLDIISDTLDAIKKANMAVEINTSGFRKPVKEQYPSIEILKLCFDKNIDITFGSDAHKIEDIGFKYNQALNIAKEIGFKECVYFRNKEKLKINI